MSRRLLALLAVALAGCGGSHADDWPDRPGPKVVVSFAPVYSVVKSVAGDDAVVKTVMTQAGPHGFQPTAADARPLRKADLFVVVGLGLDDKAAEAMRKGVDNDRLKIVHLGDAIPKDEREEGTCHHDHGDGPHEHGDDPHVWLGPARMVRMATAARDALKEADPAHAANYDRRCDEYVARLQKLKADGVAMLKGKTEKQVVTFHDSMAYFQDEFGLRVRGVVRKNPEADPTPKEVHDLVRTCVDKGVRLVAVEPQYGRSGAAQTILSEMKDKGVTDPAFVVFDPLETATPDDLSADWYERKMRDNLKSLADALR